MTPVHVFNQQVPNLTTINLNDICIKVTAVRSACVILVRVLPRFRSITRTQQRLWPIPGAIGNNFKTVKCTTLSVERNVIV